MSHIESVETKNIDDILYPPEADSKEDFYMTRDEFEQITHAFKKDEGFRKLFVDYVEEMQDPETQATYQKEMRQLELERGNIIHFINPIPGYVLKSSVDGEKKGFINICGNPLIKRAFFQSATKNEERGNMWSIPYAQSPPRDDVAKDGQFCVVYDVIFNPDTIIFARTDLALRGKLENTAIESVEKSFNVKFDKNNVKKPKLKYKGFARATVIKYKKGAELPSVIDPVAAKREFPPQRLAPPLRREHSQGQGASSSSAPVQKEATKKSSPSTLKKRSRGSRLPYSGNEPDDDDDSWTEPRYSFKYRSHVDMQDYTLDNCKTGTKTTPDNLILTVDLPLLRDSSTLDADVVSGGHFFDLKSDLRAKYKLRLKLPYQVQKESAKATFDKDKRKLIVSMKVNNVLRNASRRGDPELTTEP